MCSLTFPFIPVIVVSSCSSCPSIFVTICCFLYFDYCSILFCYAFTSITSFSGLLWIVFP